MCNPDSALEKSEAGAPEYEDSIEELAAYLYERLEHFDPSGGPDFIPWPSLPFGSRAIWLAAVRAILDREELVRRSLCLRNAQTR